MRALFWLCCVLALNAQAETYKWVDKDGNVQYTGTPPLGKKTEALRRAADPNANKDGGSIIRPDDIDALPYLTKNNQGGRKAYQEYLGITVPKLFIACASGKYFTVSGADTNYDLLIERARKESDYSSGSCHPYAYNNEVVWNRKR